MEQDHCAGQSGADISGPLAILGYNLVGDRSGAMLVGPPKVQPSNVLGVSSTDLRIDPVLRDNGGSARPHNWTHALLPGSPAIKRPDDNEHFCDIGAYESSP
jgi:hypothetical protein